MSKIETKTLFFSFICAKCAEKLQFAKIDGNNVYVHPCEKCAATAGRDMLGRAVAGSLADGEKITSGEFLRQLGDNKTKDGK